MRLKMFIRREGIILGAVFKRFLNKSAAVTAPRFSHLNVGFRILKFMASTSGTSGDAGGSSEGSFGGFRNRLGLEKSPYLLQHANNPVNWYPWGKEAFEKAKKENKLIFLSVGYSTCHWCHVMEKESFENKEIGQILNEHFVPIKVDREERPDVDQVYMLFVQATQGGGGWPLSVWLTPNLKPIVGGTYFPPEDRYFGRPGFKSVLLKISKAWQDNDKAVLQQGDEILSQLAKAAKLEIEKTSDLPDCPTVVKNCFVMLDKRYDHDNGGFGRAPKFPQPVYLEFMFRQYAMDKEGEDGRKAREMGLTTLRKMALGGMYDHIGKGFHRYSTDAEWHLPHFEKMLYDQAQLATAYASAYQVSKEPVFAEILQEILFYVTNCLRDKAGGFYSAEDADSSPTETAAEKREGAFYVWTYEELMNSLNTPLPGKGGVTDGDIFAFHYDAQKSGNIKPFADPHGELLHQNVLIVRGDLKKTAEKFDLSIEDTQQILETARQKLNDLRQKRPRPHLDNKVLTSWNGLMISGFARAAQVLDDPDCLRRASEAIEFLSATVFQPQHERLLRSCYFDTSGDRMVIGSNPIPGFADDYAMLINGLLDTYEACFDEKLIQFAEKLQNIQDNLFWDENDSGYFATAAGNESEIVLRLKDGQDGAEPSSNSISCRNLLRLSMFLGRPELAEKAVKLMTSFGSRLQNMPMAIPELVGALMFYFNTPKQIIICGDLNCDDTKALIRCINSHYLPNKVVIVSNCETPFLRDRIAVLSSMQKVDGRATAYVCENFECKKPVNTVEELEALLK